MDTNTIIEQLNTDFAIAGQVEFITGKGGFPYLQVTNEKASALISVYAGHVLAFKPVTASEDLMFVSDNAYFEQGKAIKGGIPICWPWFGAAPDDALQKVDHGLVRNRLWSVLSVDTLTDGGTKIVLEFKSSASTEATWPYAFNLCLEIIIDDHLSLTLLTRNTGSVAFSITEALHSYFKVGDATQATVSGLEQTEYLDKTRDYIKMDQSGIITISEETDRIYTDIKHQLLIDDPVLQRQIKVTSSGNKNVVVWNPWQERAAAMQDLAAEDYKHFICLEVANAASNTVEVLPHSESTMTAQYSIVER